MKKVWIVIIKGNDIFYIEKSFIATDFQNAVQEGTKLLNEFGNSTIERLEILGIMAESELPIDDGCSFSHLV